MAALTAVDGSICVSSRSWTALFPSLAIVLSDDLTYEMAEKSRQRVGGLPRTQFSE